MPHYENEPLISTEKKYGDWRDDLVENGYAVVKSVLTPEKAQSYVDRMYDWLETFPYGFKKDDKSTWKVENLPVHIKGGMYHDYSVQHEKFLWDARCEPAVIDTFAKLWDTDKLLVSFDGMNFTLPAEGRQPTQPWPHVDQSPYRKGMQCVQGILNLAPNGPEDGGLIVMRGSSKLNEIFFKAHEDQKDQNTWGPRDWFGFTPEHVQWFKDRGCEYTKVCAEPGDLILWDSRTVHQNTVPTSDLTRAVMYICYTPAEFASVEDLAKKAQLFKDRVGTTHWPHSNIWPTGKKQPEKEGNYERQRPAGEPEETEVALRLAGVLPYA